MRFTSIAGKKIEKWIFENLSATYVLGCSSVHPAQTKPQAQKVVQVVAGPGRTERFFTGHQPGNRSKGRRPEHKFRRAVMEPPCVVSGHGLSIGLRSGRAPHAAHAGRYPSMPPRAWAATSAVQHGRRGRAGGARRRHGTAPSSLRLRIWPSLATPPAVAAPHRSPLMAGTEGTRTPNRRPCDPSMRRHPSFPIPLYAFFFAHTPPQDPAIAAVRAG